MTLYQNFNMSSFIGIDRIGIWVTSGERDALLDWIAHSPLDIATEVRSQCLSTIWRWPGCGVELRDILAPGQQLEIGQDEDPAAQYDCRSLPKLLDIVNRIQNGSWQFHVSSREALEWESR